MAYIVILLIGLEEGNQSQMNFLVEFVQLAKAGLSNVVPGCVGGNCSNTVGQMPIVYFTLF